MGITGLHFNVADFIGVHGFPKIDHSGIDARIVLEQINSAKKATCNRT